LSPNPPVHQTPALLFPRERGTPRPHSLVVRTRGSHPRNPGSKPGGVTAEKGKRLPREAFFFSAPCPCPRPCPPPSKARREPPDRRAPCGARRTEDPGLHVRRSHPRERSPAGARGSAHTPAMSAPFDAGPPRFSVRPIADDEIGGSTCVTVLVALTTRCSNGHARLGGHRDRGGAHRPRSPLPRTSALACTIAARLTPAAPHR
jgi:hypothetical protein